MGYWLTREGLIEAAGLRTVEALAGSQEEAENRVLVNSAIVQAEAEIMGYVLGRYPRIVQEANPTLTAHAVKVSLWHLLSTTRGYKPDTEDEAIKINYEGSIRFLSLVAQGKADLVPDGEEASEALSGGVTAVHPERLLPPDLMDKY